MCMHTTHETHYQYIRRFATHPSPRRPGISPKAPEVLLPPYSPDLNPIEEAFSKTKGILREVGARRREALLEAISEAISMVTAQDAKGFFGHCGYHLMDQCL